MILRLDSEWKEMNRVIKGHDEKFDEIRRAALLKAPFN